MVGQSSCVYGIITPDSNGKITFKRKLCVLVCSDFTVTVNYDE